MRRSPATFIAATVFCIESAMNRRGLICLDHGMSDVRSLFSAEITASVPWIAVARLSTFSGVPSTKAGPRRDLCGIADQCHHG